MLDRNDCAVSDLGFRFSRQTWRMSALSRLAKGPQFKFVRLMDTSPYFDDDFQMNKIGTYEKLMAVVEQLERQFPNGNSPFQIITRLAEETGELACEVNLWEGAGVKREKHGEPDPKKLAKEVQDVMRCALQVARYYKIEDALAESIDESFKLSLGEKG